jgi:hypothetical protein
MTEVLDEGLAPLDPPMDFLPRSWMLVVAHELALFVYVAAPNLANLRFEIVVGCEVHVFMGRAVHLR